MRFYFLVLFLLVLMNLFGQKPVINSAIDSVHQKIEKYFNTGISDSLRNHYKTQIIHMNQYIAKDSLNSKAFLQRGIYYGQLGFQVEAISDYDRSITLDSNASVAYFNRGLAKARFRYSYDACYDLRKALSLGIESAENIYESCCGLYHSEIEKIISNQNK